MSPTDHTTDMDTRDADFRELVLASLARLETKLDAAVHAVGVHDSQIVALKEEFARHVTNCPMIDRVDALEAGASRREAMIATIDAFRRIMSPLIWLLFCCFLVLVISHADVIKSWFGK